MEIGWVAALWRYPVKPMLGAQLEEADFAERGLAGEPGLRIGGRGERPDSERQEGRMEGPLRFPDEPDRRTARRPLAAPDHLAGRRGHHRRSGEPHEKLSGAFGRGVTLVSGGAFFDLGAVHLLTTASLKKLGELYSEGSFDPSRFRPNLVLELDSVEVGFVEVNWLGGNLCLGDQVVLEVTESVARCVMTTLRRRGWRRLQG